MIYFLYTRLTRKYIYNNKKLFYFVYRLTPLTTPPVEKSTMMNLSLQEIILIGNASEQVRKNIISLKTHWNYACKQYIIIIIHNKIIIILCYFPCITVGQVQWNDYRHVPNDANLGKGKKSRWSKSCIRSTFKSIICKFKAYLNFMLPNIFNINLGPLNLIICIYNFADWNYRHY